MRTCSGRGGEDTGPSRPRRRRARSFCDTMRLLLLLLCAPAWAHVCREGYHNESSDCELERALANMQSRFRSYRAYVQDAFDRFDSQLLVSKAEERLRDFIETRGFKPPESTALFDRLSSNLFVPLKCGPVSLGGPAAVHIVRMLFSMCDWKWIFRHDVDNALARNAVRVAMENRADACERGTFDLDEWMRNDTYVQRDLEYILNTATSTRSLLPEQSITQAWLYTTWKTKEQWARNIRVWVRRADEELYRLSRKCETMLDFVLLPFGAAVQFLAELPLWLFSLLYVTIAALLAFGQVAFLPCLIALIAGYALLEFLLFFCGRW